MTFRFCNNSCGALGPRVPVGLINTFLVPYAIQKPITMCVRLTEIH